MLTGGCECGAVAFEVVGDYRKAVTVCHCSQCRRASGHLWASTKAAFADVHFTRQDGLSWFASSDFAKRGFCRFCGASLFYRKNGEEGIGIAAGCLDSPTDLHMGKHIYVADKGDYYEITDDAPQFETY